MKCYKLTIIISILIAFGLNRLNAQEAIVVSGGDISGNSGSASYSIGQIAYSTNTSSAGSIAQGVQQVFEISVVTGINKANEICLNYSVYPNPTSDFLNLKIEASTSLLISSLNYRLYDLSGLLLETKKIETNETIINMEKLFPSIYFLSVTINNKEIITFKVVKRKTL